MEFNYEENLEANPFFIKIMESHNALVNEVGSSNWILLIPKRAQVTPECLKSNEFLLSHVLLPSEDLPKTHFTSLIGADVTIDDKFIRVKNERLRPSLILFEEIFYAKDHQKFKILCIETPLCQKFIQSCPNSSSLVANLCEAVELIKQCCAVKGGGMRKIENAISNFNLRIQKASDYEKLKTNVKLLYDYCVNLICHKQSKLDPFLTMNLKVSIEYYLMENIYEKIFDAISINCSEENQKFNKIIHKLSDITIEDLNITSEPSPKVTENLNLMRMELAKVSNCKCSLDKLYCIRNVIDTISSCSSAKLMTTDELLPVLVYAIVKTNFFHWIPTLVFIKEFNLSQMLGPENQSAGSVIFYILTTLEAVIYFIQTNENLSLKKHQLVLPKKVDEISTLDDYLHHLFQYVKDNNEIQLAQLINVSYSSFIARTTSESSEESSLCHPLCSCSTCKLKIEESLSNVNLKSQSGLTMLHIASAYNVPKMISILLNHGADVNSKDLKGWTALHYSAQRGHQKVLFLLLHGKSNINAVTYYQQSPLLLATMNGHDCCVKALLYFADHASLPIDLNSTDCDGNTALHFASQAGFDAIVESLLEYRAKVTIKNNLGKIPLDYAYSSVIKSKLESAAKYQVDELPVNEQDFVFISNDDLADNIDEAC